MLEKSWTIRQGFHSLEKSLNFRGIPWIVLEFPFPLKSPWIFFSFECSNLKSVFQCFLFYTIINYQYNYDKWTEKCRELVEQTVQALKFC